MIPQMGKMGRPAPGKVRELYGCCGMCPDLMRWQAGMQGDLVRRDRFGGEH